MQPYSYYNTLHLSPDASYVAGHIKTPVHDARTGRVSCIITSNIYPAPRHEGCRINAARFQRLRSRKFINPDPNLRESAAEFFAFGTQIFRDSDTNFRKSDTNFQASGKKIFGNSLQTFFRLQEIIHIQAAEAVAKGTQTTQMTQIFADFCRFISLVCVLLNFRDSAASTPAIRLYIENHHIRRSVRLRRVNSKALLALIPGGDTRQNPVFIRTQRDAMPKQGSASG